MAIRPTDLQGSILNATQTQGITQRAEEAPRAAQAAAQASFAAHVQNREEAVEETGKGEGNRVDANAERQGQSADQQAHDRADCSQWSVSESGYDPTAANAATQDRAKRDAYFRAQAACLDARGYAVK